MERPRHDAADFEMEALAHADVDEEHLLVADRRRSAGRVRWTRELLEVHGRQ